MQFVITRRIATGMLAALSIALAACAIAPVTTPSQVPGVLFRMVDANGIKLRVAEMGEGPLVVLVHGWPESWYSWRHQIPAIAAAGYKVIAPDMRGYGKSDKPAAITDYDIHHTTADIVGLIDAYGAEKAVVIGHASLDVFRSLVNHRRAEDRQKVNRQRGNSVSSGLQNFESLQTQVVSQFRRGPPQKFVCP
jgi:hypothetical protein